tara:strand:- start:2243 stop:2596 length:354 start_codon:yes stop_codon:yes gene_type:complete
MRSGLQQIGSGVVLKSRGPCVGGRRMTRRRTGTRYVPISISLTPDTVNAIEAKLHPKESRSKWIANAIKVKLADDDDLDNVSTSDLLVELLFRGIINSQTRWTLQALADSKASIDEH